MSCTKYIGVCYAQQTVLYRIFRPTYFYRHEKVACSVGDYVD